MHAIVFLFTGLIVGSILAYFIFKLTLQRHFISKAEIDRAHQTITDLRLENASKLSKNEVEYHYVSRELYLNLQENLHGVKLSLEAAHHLVIQLTGESREKLSKEEVESNYVAKNSFDIIDRARISAETELSKREQIILNLNSEITELKNKEEFLNEKITLFKEELEALHLRSQEQFKNIAQEVLDEKRKVFLDENKKELHNILDPFKTNLTEFREKIESTRKEDIQDMTSLKKEIESLQKLNNQLSDDARNLATALKAEVKMQGNWGEDRLNMILEVEGLQKYIDYSREEMYRDEEQEKNRKPDFILKLPNDKCIIIDSKVSLTAYVNYFNAPTAEEKVEHLKQHLNSITTHINQLADKNYQSLTGLNSPDYVFMFMPVESALTLALNQNPEIFNNALKRKIVLITPTTLVATLKVVKILWQKENQVKNVEEIFRQCGELYDKFVSFLGDMDKIEGALSNAVQAHRDAMYSLKDGTKKGNTIIGRFETIKKLEAKTNKSIPEKHLKDIELWKS